MPQGHPKLPALPRRRTAPNWSALALLAVGIALIAGPLILSLWRSLAPSSAPPMALLSPPPPLASPELAWSLGAPLAIALTATALAWPTCWLLLSLPPHRRRALAILIALPALMPSTLSFAGWGLLTSPVGPLHALPQMLIARGNPELPILLNKLVALASLALWLWPLSTALLWPALRSTPAGELDALAQLTPSYLRRTRTLLARHRRSVLTALGVAALLATGATVPLHLAQIPSLGVSLWARLALDPTARSAWTIAWPLLPTCLALAIVLARQASWPAPAAAAVELSRAARPLPNALCGSLCLLALACALAGPLLAAVTLAGSRGSYTLAWQDLTTVTPGFTTTPLTASALVALLVALASFALGALALRASEPQNSPTPVARWTRTTNTSRPAISLTAPLSLTLTLTVAILALGASLPGVLIGAAIAGTIATLTATLGLLVGQDLTLGVFAVALGHIARLALIPVLAGLVLARLEPPELAETRRQLAGPGLRPWFRTTLRPALAPLAACALACAALSLHEIEATIQLQPPGYRGVAQLLLDYLHMNSARQLGATLTIIIGAALALALLGAGVAGARLWRGRWTETPGT